MTDAAQSRAARRRSDAQHLSGTPRRDGGVRPAGGRRQAASRSATSGSTPCPRRRAAASATSKARTSTCSRRTSSSTATTATTTTSSAIRSPTATTAPATPTRATTRSMSTPWSVTIDEDVEYCYLDGPHYHCFAPPRAPSSRSSVARTSTSREPPPVYVEARPAMIKVNAVYTPLVYTRPVVAVEAPSGWIGVRAGFGGAGGGDRRRPPGRGRGPGARSARAWGSRSWSRPRASRSISGSGCAARRDRPRPQAPSQAQEVQAQEVARSPLRSPMRRLSLVLVVALVGVGVLACDKGGAAAGGPREAVVEAWKQGGLNALGADRRDRAGRQGLPEPGRSGRSTCWSASIPRRPMPRPPRRPGSRGSARRPAPRRPRARC